MVHQVQCRGIQRRLSRLEQGVGDCRSEVSLPASAGAEDHEPAVRVVGKGFCRLQRLSKGSGLSEARSPLGLKVRKGEPRERPELAVTSQEFALGGAPGRRLALASVYLPEAIRADGCIDREPAQASADLAVPLDRGGVSLA